MKNLTKDPNKFVLIKLFSMFGNKVVEYLDNFFLCEFEKDLLILRLKKLIKYLENID